MKTKQTLVCGWLAVIITLSSAACTTDGHDHEHTTWTVTSNSTTNATALNFNFNDWVSELSASDITIADGTGSATRGALTGSGTSRSLAITVLSSGTVYVSINRSGIASRLQTVTLAGLPILTGMVSITGTPEVGQTLTANTDDLSGSGDISFQWRRGTTNIGTDSSTYVVQNADVGSIITVTVTRTDNSGSITSPPIAIGAILVPVGVTLAEQLSWIRGFGQIGNHYIVQISGNENISPINAALPTGRNNTITIRGREAVHEVRLSANGRFFTIGSGVTLVLDENVALVGRGGVGSHVTAVNDNHLVRINSGGTLIMNEGARIVGNVFSSSVATVTAATAQGGGVYVASGGTFTMNGGEISGNVVAANRGGSQNTTVAAAVTAQGGGVSVSGGTFTMNGGVISGNIVTATRAATAGNVVWVPGGTTTQEPLGNVIAQGGGVFVSAGTFTMNGGEISGNTVTAGRTAGGGTIAAQGGGVFSGATFDMRGGAISGNRATNGGGVFVANGTIFRISNGIVRGNETAVATALRNTSGDGLSASLHNAGTTQRGTFSNGTFSSLGTLSTTNITINVLNGELQW